MNDFCTHLFCKHVFICAWGRGSDEVQSVCIVLAFCASSQASKIGYCFRVDMKQVKVGLALLLVLARASARFRHVSTGCFSEKGFLCVKKMSQSHSDVKKNHGKIFLLMK